MPDETNKPAPAKKTAAPKKAVNVDDPSAVKLPSPTLAGGPSQDDLNPAYAPPKDDKAKADDAS